MEIIPLSVFKYFMAAILAVLLVAFSPPASASGLSASASPYSNETGAGLQLVAAMEDRREGRARDARRQKQRSTDNGRRRDSSKPNRNRNTDDGRRQRPASRNAEKNRRSKADDNRRRDAAKDRERRSSSDKSRTVNRDSRRNGADNRNDERRNAGNRNAGRKDASRPRDDRRKADRGDRREVKRDGRRDQSQIKRSARRDVYRDNRRNHRYADRPHRRSGAYRHPTVRYSGHYYKHGHGPRRGHGYWCASHRLFHYYNGYSPFGWLYVSFGWDLYDRAYIGDCDVVSQTFHRRGRRYQEVALLCYDAWGYGYIRPGSRRVYRAY